MIKQFDRHYRRFLNFPAVCPCRDISPATLLRSLISLSQNICKYRFEFFAVHKKNSRETLRKIEILLVFLEEIEDRKANLSDMIVISLIELHVALQKILFLFEDCTCGARLNVLVKSNFITAQFREQIRLVADSLDIILLGEIDISSEIRELIELVAKQARKAKFETDPDDELALQRVILILSQFENKIEPDRSLIKWVLDYLGVKTWRDCHNEIKIIDEEISIESSEGTNREVKLMSSLSGFMCYCRGVIFETEDFGYSIPTRGRKSFEIAKWHNAEDFRCPISLELMTDPVTVSTGQTYDRSSIQKWLKSGNLICPTTGKKLANTNLVPNSVLRKLIVQFCADNEISLARSKKKSRDITRTILPDSPSSAESIKFLSEFLSDRLSFGSEENKNKAAYEIGLLAKSNIFNRARLIQAGTVPPLLHLLNSIDAVTQENAMAALLKLSKHASGTKAIVENGGLKVITSVLKDGLKLESKQIAAATIFYLTSVSEFRKLIGQSREALPALAKLMKEGTNFGKKNAIVAIFGILLHKSNHQRVISAGIIPILVDILNEDELLYDSLAVISALAESKEGSLEISKTSFFSTLIRILRSSSSRTAREHCVSILLNLCYNCGENKVAELAKESSLMNLLFSVSTDGTSHARKKARSLIRVLHGYLETSLATSLRENALSHEQSIHVR